MTRLGVYLLLSIAFGLTGCASAKPAPREDMAPASTFPPPREVKCSGTGDPIPDFFAQLNPC